MKVRLSITLALLCGVTTPGRTQPTTESALELAELVVPLDKSSPFLESARDSLDGTLADIPGQSVPRSMVSKSGRFILWGDLFKTGGCYALAELTGQSDEESNLYGVALGEWTGGKWQMRGVWKIPTVWRPEGWEASGDDYLPTTPASQPFELRDLSRDGVPEVVIAGPVSKYFQENYLLRFSRKTHSLRLVACAMGKPEMVDRGLVDEGLLWIRPRG